MLKIFWFLIFFKSPESGKENVRFTDSPDFDNLPDFRTGRNGALDPVFLKNSSAFRLKFVPENFKVDIF